MGWSHLVGHGRAGGTYPTLFLVSVTSCPGGPRPFSRCGGTDSRLTIPSRWLMPTAGTSSRAAAFQGWATQKGIGTAAWLPMQTGGTSPGMANPPRHQIPFLAFDAMASVKKPCCAGAKTGSKFCLPSSAELQGTGKGPCSHLHHQQEEGNRVESPEGNPGKAKKS